MRGRASFRKAPRVQVCAVRRGPVIRRGVNGTRTHLTRGRRTPIPSTVGPVTVRSTTYSAGAAPGGNGRLAGRTGTPCGAGQVGERFRRPGRHFVCQAGLGSVRAGHARVIPPQPADDLTAPEPPVPVVPPAEVPIKRIHIQHTPYRPRSFAQGPVTPPSENRENWASPKCSAARGRSQ